MPPSDPAPHADTVALFRYGLIADLLHLPAGDRSLHARLREKASREYDIPGTTRRHVAAETLRDWLYAYRRAGFDGLKPRPRADQGHARALPQTVADQLCALKEAHPTYSVALVIATARAQQRVPADLPLAPATVHRLLSRHGLMARPTDAPTSKDRRRFSYDAANELWMSDVMHGPTVLDADDRRRHKTYLIALLDDATRMIPYAAFTRSETVTAFLPVFERAILRRGIPKRLYVESVSGHRFHVLCPVRICGEYGRSRRMRATGIESRHIIPPRLTMDLDRRSAEGGSHARTLLHQTPDDRSHPEQLARRGDRTVCDVAC